MHPALTEQLVTAHQLELTHARHQSDRSDRPATPPRHRLWRLLGHTPTPVMPTK